MTRRSTVILLVVVGLFIAYLWYRVIVGPGHPEEIFPFWSRMMLLIPASVIWVVAVGLGLTSDRRRTKGHETAREEDPMKRPEE